MTCNAHAESPGHGEGRQGYSALSRLTGLMAWMVQTTCHQAGPDGADGSGFAKARFAKGVVNEGSGRRHLPWTRLLPSGRRGVRCASSERPSWNPKRRTLRASNLLL